MTFALLSMLLTGCDTTSDSSGEAPSWDPCEAFPESVMQQLGYDHKLQAKAPGRECAWSSDEANMSPSIHYFKNGVEYNVTDGRSKAVELAEVTIGPYAGYRYRSEGLDPNFVCSVLLETKNSRVLFSVYATVFGGDVDPCPVVTHIATELVGYLPLPAE
ncbi:DUF3558 family protein [Nocardia sp. NPDC058519]|uniref:DUF3558 family protein n=1 Tax=Nocardia sp. NPDC058519 TaxID=3346535 RepID=UPI00364786C2